MFLDMKDNCLMFRKLKEENWKTDPAFLVNVLEQLQGRNFILHELYTEVQALKTKQKKVLKTY
jgi:hypothetical protein